MTGKIKFADAATYANCPANDEIAATRPKGDQGWGTISLPLGEFAERSDVSNDNACPLKPQERPELPRKPAYRNQTFRASDLKRVLKTIQIVGLNVLRLEIELTGKIVILLREGNRPWLKGKPDEATLPDDMKVPRDLAEDL